MSRGTKQRKFNTVTLPGMGRTKAVKSNLKHGSAFKKSNASTKIGRANGVDANAIKSGGQQRTKNTLKRLEMYRQKAPNKRDLHATHKPMRIEPDRRWFGNTRVIAQTKMDEFRGEMAKEMNDPYSVVLKGSKLPMSLITDNTKTDKMDLLKVESYAETLHRRKKPKLSSYEGFAGLMAKTEESHAEYTENNSEGAVGRTDKDLCFALDSGVSLKKEYEGHDVEEVFLKGTSKRIWKELYKVVDSSDVIIQVLDARDPLGTRCMQLERDIKKNHPHKHMVLLLNKCDLIPNWATRRWVEVLRKEKPTLAFHASVTNPFGKSALIQLLRQFALLMKDKKNLQVGLIGYPNVGKSSVINTLKKKESCKSAPVPGQTKIWQYIALTKKIYAIDSPGIVPATSADFRNDTAKVLKGVVRAEKLEAPSAYIDEVLARCKRKYLLKKYNLPVDTTFKDGEEFLEIMARKMGKLKKGGEADIETAARIVLYDWQRGRIPFFVAPPMKEDGKGKSLIETETQKLGSLAADGDFTGVKSAVELIKKGKEGRMKVKAATSSKAVAKNVAKNGDDTKSTMSTEAGDEDGEEEEADSEEEGEEMDGADSDDEDDANGKEGEEDGEAVENSDSEAINSGDEGSNDGTTVEATGTVLPQQHFSNLKCAMDFDDEDMEQEGNEGSSPANGASSTGNRLPKLSKKEKAKARRQKRMEQSLAMNSDDSDVDVHFSDDEDNSPRTNKRKLREIQAEDAGDSDDEGGKPKKKAKKTSGESSQKTPFSGENSPSGKASKISASKVSSSPKNADKGAKEGKKKGSEAKKGGKKEEDKKPTDVNWEKALEEFMWTVGEKENQVGEYLSRIGGKLREQEETM